MKFIYQTAKFIYQTLLHGELCCHCCGGGNTWHMGAAESWWWSSLVLPQHEPVKYVNWQYLSFKIALPAWHVHMWRGLISDLAGCEQTPLWSPSARPHNPGRGLCQHVQVAPVCPAVTACADMPCAACTRATPSVCFPRA